MDKTTEISREISIGPQPSEEDLKQLREAGFRTIINLRVPHEEEQQLAPETEGGQVRELGMTYLHIPVTMKQVRPEQVEEFCHALDVLEKPVFVHCKAGTRAGVFALLQTALKNSWSSEETLKQGQRMGIDCNKPGMSEFVREFVDEHGKSS